MRPYVLDAARQRDRCALGQRRSAKIDLEVGQLPADAGIEGRIDLGLGERHARRGDSARQHRGKRAAIDGHDGSSLIERLLWPSNAWSENRTSGACVGGTPLYSSSRPPCQRFTTAFSMPNRSSRRPTVWLMMSSTVLGRL